MPDSGPKFKLLHVGVAVPALESATKSLEDLFGYTVLSGPIHDPIQKVIVSFLTTAGSEEVAIELIAPAADDSPSRSMLDKGSGGAYHLCFETNDIEAALAHAQGLGCIVVALPVPAIAFGGRRIAWIYTPSRQLFEIVEAEAGE
jgi:methylmalonyl-CoA/ethylmalonyl-CoA epimerase